MKNTRNLESITFLRLLLREIGIFTFFWDILATPIASTRKRVPYVSPLSRNTNIDLGRESARDYILSGYGNTSRSMRLKEIEFKDRDNTDARHPGKARFKWNFNSTSRFPQRYTAGEHVREINFLFTSYSQRIRERKINRRFLHRNITIYLASKHIRVRSIRYDTMLIDKTNFPFLFTTSDER